MELICSGNHNRAALVGSVMRVKPNLASQEGPKWGNQRPSPGFRAVDRGESQRCVGHLSARTRQLTSQASEGRPDSGLGANPSASLQSYGPLRALEGHAFMNANLPRTCPRCRGSMIIERDWYGAYGTCLCCGYVHEAVTAPPIDLLEEEEGHPRQRRRQPSHGKLRL